MRDLAIVQIEQRQEDFYVIEAKALARRHNEEDRRHTDVTLSIANGWLALREKLATEMFGPKPLDPTLYAPWMRLDRVSVSRTANNPEGKDAEFYKRWWAIVDASGLARRSATSYVAWARDPSKLEKYREDYAERAEQARKSPTGGCTGYQLANRLKVLLAEKGEAALIAYIMEGCPRVKSK